MQTAGAQCSGNKPNSNLQWQPDNSICKWASGYHANINVASYITHLDELKKRERSNAFSLLSKV